MSDPNMLLARARARAAEDEILRYERNVNEALRTMSQRAHYEATTVDTPLSDVIDGEDGMLDEWGVRNETLRAFFDFLTADGPEPWKVMRRLFLAGDHMMIEPFCHLTLREKAKLFHCSHEDVRWWMKRVCIAPLQRNGARSYKAPGQKSLRAGEVASAVQQGNDNRSRNHRRVCDPAAADRPSRKTKTTR